MSVTFPSRRVLLLSGCLLVLGCDDSEPAAPAPAPSSPSTDCDPTQAECTFFHDFGLTSINSGEERTDECYSYKVNNPTDLWVNTVELANDGAFHHSNWFFVPENMYDSQTALVRCHDIGFSELVAALTGGVLFAQSTQSRQEAQRFPAGSAVLVPAYSRIIASAHLLNASPKTLETGLRLTLHTLPPPAVKVSLAPFRLSYTDLHLPPMQHSQFTGDCNLRDNFESTVGQPFSMKLYYVLPHFHALGEMFRLELSGGPTDGQTLFELHDGIGDAHGQTFDPPLDVSAGTGFRFTCGYNNTGTSEVQWGNGGAEMCVMLGFAESKARYDGTVSKDKTAVDNGGVSMHSGPCGVAVYPFMQ